MLAVVLGILTLGGSMAMTPKEQKLSFSGPFRFGRQAPTGISVAGAAANASVASTSSLT